VTLLVLIWLSEQFDFETPEKHLDPHVTFGRNLRLK